MRGRPITSEEIEHIQSLRATGHSLPEIMRITKRGCSTVFAYISKVTVKPPYDSILKAKQGGSIARSKRLWNESREYAHKLLAFPLTESQRLCLMLGLYWGEGTKTELNIINSDPALIKVFITCIRDFGIQEKQLKISLRIYKEINRKDAVTFWTNFLELPSGTIQKIDVIQGNKVNKLKYGMCRVRVAKSGPYFKLVSSLISKIKESFNAAVVQRIEQGTPKP